MLQYVLKLGDLFVTHVSALDRNQWLALSAVVVVVGLACMRGFGSRTNY